MLNRLLFFFIFLLCFSRFVKKKDFLKMVFKTDREKWMWYEGLTTVQYVQNLWCYFEFPSKLEDLIYYNFWWMCLDWPPLFPDIMFT